MPVSGTVRTYRFSFLEISFDIIVSAWMFYLHLCPCPPYMPHPPLRPELGIRSPGRAISDGCGRPRRCRKSIPGLLSGNALIYRAISPALAAESFLVAFGFLIPARNLVRHQEEEAEHPTSSPVLIRPLPEHLANAVVVLNFLQEIGSVGTPSHVQDSLLTPHPVTTCLCHQKTVIPVY